MASAPKDTTPKSHVGDSHHKDTPQDQRDHGHNVDHKQRADLRAARASRLEGEESIANEQMMRSREIETLGVEAWKAKQDQRPPEDQPVIVKDYIAGGDVLNTPVAGQQRVPGITHPIAETPQRAPVRNPDGSIPR